MDDIYVLTNEDVEMAICSNGIEDADMIKEDVINDEMKANIEFDFYAEIDACLESMKLRSPITIDDLNSKGLNNLLSQYSDYVIETSEESDSDIVSLEDFFKDGNLFKFDFEERR